MKIQGLREKRPYGNRDLFLDDVFVLSLIAFHNPTLGSLRILEDFSQSIQALREQLVRKQVLRDNRDGLAVILKRVLAVDGTWMTAMADVLWARKQAAK
jgi:hypothetical protein